MLATVGVHVEERREEHHRERVPIARVRERLAGLEIDPVEARIEEALVAHHAAVRAELHRVAVNEVRRIFWRHENVGVVEISDDDAASVKRAEGGVRVLHDVDDPGVRDAPLAPAALPQPQGFRPTRDGVHDEACDLAGVRSYEIHRRGDAPGERRGEGADLCDLRGESRHLRSVLFCR
jgi:hypothetical protein